MAGLALPTIKRRHVQQLAAPDPMSHVREAGARAKALSSMSGGIEKVAGAVDDYAKREDQSNIRDANLAVHQSDMDFRAANEGKEEFDIMEVDDENLINIADGLGFEDPGEAIPSYKVYAEWRSMNYKDSVTHASKAIRNPKARARFIQGHDSKGATQYTGDAIKSRKRQIEYTAKTTMAAVEKSILNKDFMGARIAVEDSGMSEERTSSALKSIDKQEQDSYFQETIEKRSIPQMEKALNQLATNDPIFTSELQAKEQKVLANQLRTAISVEENAIQAGANTKLKMAREELKNQTTDLQDGMKVDHQKMEENMNALGVVAPVIVQKARWAQNNQKKLSDIRLELPEVQNAVYQNMIESSTGDVEENYSIRQVGKVISEDQRLYQVDAMKRASDTGFIMLEPMDYSSPGTVAKGLTKRLDQAASIQDGHRAFTGFFTNAELAEFGNYIENKSIPEQLDIFGGISASLGENAGTLYEQLKTNGVTGTAAIAGQLIAKGPQYREVAENILKGAELRKNNTVTQLKIKEANLNSTITAKFGTLFAGNPKHQSLMADAFKDVWAMTENSDTAFEQLVGEVIEYRGGGIIQSPAPGVGFYKYDWHLKDIMPEWWAGGNMQAYGYTPEQLREGVIDGSLTQIGVGEKVTNLMATDGSIVTRPDGKTPLPFSIDMSEPTMGARNKAIDEKNRRWLKEKKREKTMERAAELQTAWDAWEGRETI